MEKKYVIEYLMTPKSSGFSKTASVLEEYINNRFTNNDWEVVNICTPHIENTTNHTFIITFKKL
jgi:hypothetical protein